MKYIKELNPEPPATETLEGTPGFVPPSELPEGLAAICPNGINREIALNWLETLLNGWADTNPDQLRRFVRENQPQSAEELIIYTAAFSRAGLPFTITRRH